MLSVIGALLGFAGSAVPAVVDHFKQKEINKLELAKMDKQIEVLKAGADIDLRMFEAKAADNEHARLIEHDMSMSGETGFFGSLRKSVRPVITYMFFALFAAVKISTLLYAYQDSGNFLDSINLIWDEESQAIFSAVIAYWFGSRALEKRRRRI